MPFVFPVWPNSHRGRSIRRRENRAIRLPTFLAAAGEPHVVDKLKAGHTHGDATYKVHVDGYHLLPS